MRPVLLAALLVAVAPMQCPSKSNPDMRRDDSPGDALWELSESFRARGNQAAADDTLRYLVEKYPSSRFAPAAREKLGAGGAAKPAASASP
jgi:outer membrane protein assembly factor BamD (BamD/ComL family)